MSNLSKIITFNNKIRILFIKYIEINSNTSLICGDSCNAKPVFDHKIV